MGVNVIGPLLFTQLLLPQLRAAAASSPKNSVRIVWTSSMMMESTAPPGGYNLQDIEKGGTKDTHTNYATSKAANWILAVEAGARWGGDGILSVSESGKSEDEYLSYTA
ncbi:hypothetical protein LHYA1_G008720 [Lachnellula hyalina]|uniref:Uncharacterized protein n=1 Tax=Lachnellula hyalina TaxID=1316788 RepID=A0A8H8TVL6_9HELO|nr:uncharacterized protein LHYA1_G008720 [Lachnellula hyalina]TVY22375.1 hypothetical protein LHYA1_G008720 [Lachnellula hyalina]